MADIDQIRRTIQQTVSQRFGANVELMQREIVEQVLREVEPFLGSGNDGRPSAATSESQDVSQTSAMLSTAAASIQESSVQADILKALLEGVSGFSARSALFVVRGTTLAGWQARGFSDDNIRGLSLDGSQGLAARAIQDRNRASAGATEFDSAFVEKQGKPWDGNATLFPLVVKDKVAAILYCDSGREQGRQTDYSAVEVLTRFTCLWLEHSAVKKHLGSSGPEATAAPAASVSAAAPTPAPQPPAPKPAAVPEPTPNRPSTEDEELHKKAKRFAKLLVDEIKLYNQSKVAEGRQNRDLYKVLREDIEKSRATYDKRYGSTPVASARYFDSEVVRILADNDRSLLGSDFPG